MKIQAATKSKNISRYLASVNLTIVVLLVLIIASLIGAWIPQSNQVQEQEILQRFGTDGTSLLKTLGFVNIFQSPIFLGAIGLLFINLMTCTAVTMAPRIKARLKFKDHLEPELISKLPINKSLQVPEQGIDEVTTHFRERGFTVNKKDNELIAEKGKLAWLAAPITHLGLFVLLIGVIITSLTGYSGTIYLQPGSSLNLSKVHKENPILGKVPDLNIKLKSTKRVNYKSGKPKQWYSTIEIKRQSGKSKTGTVSVNNPFEFNGISFYQSDWALDSANLKLADQDVRVPLKEMAGEHMGVFPLLPDLLMIVAVEKPNGKAKIYLKPDSSHHPKLIAKLLPNGTKELGKLPIKYIGTTVRTGLQYRYDPGQIIVYAAFCLLFLGAIFVAIPSVRIWIALSKGDTEEESAIFIGSKPTKFKSLVLKEFALIESRFNSSDKEVLSIDA